jgi:hypothetical protein
MLRLGSRWTLLIRAVLQSADCNDLRLCANHRACAHDRGRNDDAKRV